MRNPARQMELRHAFKLRQGDASPLVELPSQPWDGDWQSVTETVVDLQALAATVSHVHDEVLDLHDRGLIQLRLDPAEARRRYFFVHGVDVEEWNAQEASDSPADA